MKFISTLFTATLVTLVGTSNLHANSMLMKMSADSNQWVMPTGDYANHRYSALDQINADNVGDLKVAWTFPTGVLGPHLGNPLVIGSMMYVHTPFPNKVIALDLDNDASIVWKYEPKQDLAEVWTANLGIAYDDGKIFLYQADTTVVALDAKRGKVLWSAKNGDISKGEAGTSAPMVVDDKVYIGISGSEFGVRGHLTAYDINTGERVWRGYSMGPDSDTLMGPATTHLGQSVGKDSGLKTWESYQWKVGGGRPWGWFSYDPEVNLIYYGTDGPAPSNPVQRPGENRWSSTIFARDADSGQAKWVYQMTPWNQWGYDGVNEMILADISVNGVERKTLVHFGRNGFGYTLDRVTGELLVAEKYDPVVNWATHVDMRTGRPQVVARYAPGEQGEDVNTTDICPAALGTKNQQLAAFSLMTGLFYVPTNHVCMNYEPFRVSYAAGQPYVGAELKMYPAPGGDHMGNFIYWDTGTGEIKWSNEEKLSVWSGALATAGNVFIAWDAGTGKIKWRNEEKFSIWGGALATAGGVVFYGTLEGYLEAVDAKTGKELYRFKTRSGIIGNVMTYTHKGKQYVAVLSGVDGWAGIGMAARLTEDSDGLGAVGDYRRLQHYTRLGGGVLTVILPLVRA